jgi:octaprenyl-diphosphate synthase
MLDGVAGMYPGVLAQACASTLAAGGKRVRPLLALVCARRDRPLNENTVRAAASVELLHMATLVHDDVLDNASLRRGKPTVAHSFGVETAVSAGNFLLSRAFALLALTGDGHAVELLSDAALGLSRGELLQMDEAFDSGLTEDDYLRRCELKTAGLFTVACRLGARTSGVDESVASALGAYGNQLGVAFQILDDILDFSGDEEVTGKRRGVDLRDGTITLPMIYALEARPELGPRLERPAKDDALVDEILSEVRSTGALECAHKRAQELIAAARQSLADCPETIDVDLLNDLADVVVDRHG